MTNLNLYYCYKITDAGIKNLAEGCKWLETLDLSYCYNVTDDGVNSLVAKCKWLKTIGLYKTKVTEKLKKSLREKGIKVN